MTALGSYRNRVVGLDRSHHQDSSEACPARQSQDAASWVSSLGGGFTYSRGAGQRGYTEVGDRDDDSEWGNDDDGHYSDKAREGTKKVDWCF